MAGVQPTEQDKARAEAAQVIREMVQPAYGELLKFLRDEYVPGTRTTLAAEACRTARRITARRSANTPRSICPREEIHQIGEAEVARLHQQMVDVMKETGFKGDFLPS